MEPLTRGMGLHVYFKPNGKSPSGEAAQTPTPATSERGLGREARAALLRLKTGPECPEGNLSELTCATKPDCGRSVQTECLIELIEFLLSAGVP